MTWTVHVHENAAKQLRRIPPDRRKRILDDLAALEEDPFRSLVKPRSCLGTRGPISSWFCGRLERPHAAQGPICTVACLHIDAATPNAWLQETFEDWNEPWQRRLLTGFPPIVDGHFEPPAGPGLGIDLDLEEVRRHPYHEKLDMSLFEENWHFRRSAHSK